MQEGHGSVFAADVQAGLVRREGIARVVGQGGECAAEEGLAYGQLQGEGVTGAEGLDQISQPHQVELWPQEGNGAAQVEAGELREGVCPVGLKRGQGGFQFVQIRRVGELEAQAATQERIMSLILNTKGRKQ